MPRHAMPEPRSSRALPRRTFLGSLALGLAAGSLGLRARADENPRERRLGIALVGLGGYASGELAPALQQTRFCSLAGIVTGSPNKIPRWQRRYGIPDASVYNYETFDRIADNPAIDIVYIVLPTGMHAEYTIRAAKAGKHVICEKPMAISTRECDAMIAACREAGKTLQIGYRLHWDPYNRDIMRFAREQTWGAVQEAEADFGFVMGQWGGWRLSKALSGGGPLTDLGVYCMQAACYATGEVPNAVANASVRVDRPELFTEVEEHATWEFAFASGKRVRGSASYGRNVNRLHVLAERGPYRLEPAYAYRGLSGITPDGPLRHEAPNQQALQMDGMARAILDGTPSLVPGEMGRRDIALIEAIYRAAETGGRVEIPNNGLA